MQQVLVLVLVYLLRHLDQEVVVLVEEELLLVEMVAVGVAVRLRKELRLHLSQLCIVRIKPYRKIRFDILRDRVAREVMHEEELVVRVSQPVDPPVQVRLLVR